MLPGVVFVPTSQLGMARNSGWPGLLTHGTATHVLRPFICTNGPGCFFCFCLLFFFFKKGTRSFVVESRYFKNTSKGYNQVMKMLNIIKDNTKIFTKIFTKAILKIIDLHTEHQAV